MYALITDNASDYANIGNGRGRPRCRTISEYNNDVGFWLTVNRGFDSYAHVGSATASDYANIGNGRGRPRCRTISEYNNDVGFWLTVNRGFDSYAHVGSATASERDL